MAEKRMWNSKLNAKGLDDFVSTEQARDMCLHQGSTHIFIVQAHAGPKTVNEDGSEVVSLIADLVELVPEQHAETVRRFQRSLRMERPDQIGQSTIDSISEQEAKSEDVARDIAAVTTDYADPQTEWDGNPDAPTHDVDQGDMPRCPAPDCVLAEDHDGDHQERADEESNVVEFSGKG